MKTTDPVVALIAIAVITIEAAWILLRAALVPVVALLLTLAQWRPAAPAAAEPVTTSGARKASLAPDTSTQRPQPHPLATIATELELLPVTALRQMAGIRSKAIRKSELVAMVAACS